MADRITVPASMFQSKLPGDGDVLQMLLDALEKDGDLSDTEWRHTVLLALGMIVIRVRETKDTTLQGIFKRKPVQFLAVLVVAFIFLHDLATYLNLRSVMDAALKVLGVPVP